MELVRKIFSRRASGDLTAINLHADRIDVARVHREMGARPKVEVCAQFSGGGQHAEQLQRVRRELHLEKYRCATMLSLGHYQVQVVEAPNVPEAELKSAVRWRLKDFLDYPVESATVDVLPVPGSAGPNRGRSVYAVSARSEDIRATMKMFSRAKLDLCVIDIPEMAQRNLAALFENDQRAVALLSFSTEGGLLTFSAQGELYLSRRMETTIEQLLASEGETRDRLFERIALELQRSLDHFDRQHNSVPLSRVLIAPLPGDIRLAEYLTGNLSTKVEMANLGEVLDIQHVPELQEGAGQLRHWQVLGTALRVDPI